MLEEDVNRHDSDRADDGFGKHAVSAETAYSGGTPDRCGGGETLDGIAVLEDDTRAQETYTRNDLGDDSAVIATKDRGGHEDVQGATYRYKRYRTCSDHLSVEFSLHADEIAEGGGQYDFGNDK